MMTMALFSQGARLTRRFMLGVLITVYFGTISQTITQAATVKISIDSPLVPPEWALLERSLLDANEQACAEFFAKYFDERGFLLCVERWGGDDGPDDAIENCSDWPILHALGSSDAVLRMYKKAWEGHLRQFTLAKTVEVPFARDGMYYKEFPVMMDWLHNGEGLTVFNLQGLSDPDDADFQRRVMRFAGFYMDEDPQARNYDPQHKIIRSLLNGSRGPLLRQATALDWTGDPIEVEHRFELGHHERSYEEMLAHFRDYNDVVGDHPSNLLATSLAFNAYAVTGAAKYRDWLLEYVEAWRQRTLENDGIIPSNIGLDGTIGGATNGNWWGGVYGWGFTVVEPQTGQLAHRSTFQSGFNGFMNAYALTGDDRYLDVWRQMLEKVNSHKKTIDGIVMYPQKYGADGWYNYSPSPFAPFALEMYYLSRNPHDLQWVGSNSWLEYLNGRQPDFAVNALRGDLARVQKTVAAMREDTTTPDTRLSDDPMKYNPASVTSLIHLMLGGLYPGHRGSPLYCYVRYFDPIERRAGIPPDVAALIDSVADDQITLTLVNTNQVQPRELVIQAGAYAEHEFLDVTTADGSQPVNARTFNVRLAPGAGQRMAIKVRRFVNPPSMQLPWNR